MSTRYHNTTMRLNASHDNETRGRAYKGTLAFSFIFLIISIMTAFEHEETRDGCLFVLAAFPHLIGHQNNKETRAGVQGTLAFSFYESYLLILITID
jgi:hypothetical protein